MRFATIALATFFVVAPAAFTASFAQTSAVSDKTFDWIFFVIIVPLPFMALFDTLMNDGSRPGNPDGVARRYPRTVSPSFGARPMTEWQTAEQEEIIAQPGPETPRSY